MLYRPIFIFFADMGFMNIISNLARFERVMYSKVETYLNNKIALKFSKAINLSLKI